MRGSHISNPTLMVTTAVALVAVLASAPAVRAADIDQPAALGQPIVLFSPETPSAAPSGVAHNAVAAAPAKRPATPVRRIPLDGKPLIPPAAPAVKLEPPPAPRPALSLETDLQPLAPSPAPPAGASNPAASKAPSS
jgi:hypothetical protein